VLGRSHSPNQFRRVLPRRPELVPLAVAAACWVALLWLHLGRHPTVAAHSAQHGSHHAVVLADFGSVSGLIAETSGMSIGMWLGMWTLMCAAMMIPTVIPAIRHVAANSLRRRAGRSIAVLVGTYLAGWFVFGLVALALLTLVRWLDVPAWVMLLSVILIGILWLVLPVQRRFRWACHKSVPLPPTGWRAVRGCARFGCRQALACVGICWPLMLLMALQLNASIIWMFALAALVTVWKYLPRRYRPTLRTWAVARLSQRWRGAGVVAMRSPPLGSA
jgi:predicted metal-binding membrane protein